MSAIINAAITFQRTKLTSAKSVQNKVSEKNQGGKYNLKLYMQGYLHPIYMCNFLIVVIRSFYGNLLINANLSGALKANVFLLNQNFFISKQISSILIAFLRNTLKANSLCSQMCLTICKSALSSVGDMKVSSLMYGTL